MVCILKFNVSCILGTNDELNEVPLVFTKTSSGQKWLEHLQEIIVGLKSSVLTVATRLRSQRQRGIWQGSSRLFEHTRWKFKERRLYSSFSYVDQQNQFKLGQAIHLGLFIVWLPWETLITFLTGKVNVFVCQIYYVILRKLS